MRLTLALRAADVVGDGGAETCGDADLDLDLETSLSGDKFESDNSLRLVPLKRIGDLDWDLDLDLEFGIKGDLLRVGVSITVMISGSPR